MASRHPAKSRRASTAKKSTARKSTTKKKSSRPKSKAKRKSKRGASRRELINTGTDKRYVRRTSGGKFKESDDVGRSLSADRRKKAKTKARRGQGDRGDR